MEEYFKNSTKLISGIGNYIKPYLEQISENRIIEHIVDNAVNFSLLKTILHKDNVKLKDIYLPLDLMHKNSKIDDFREFLESNNKVTIIATGGAGKTTFIKHFYIECVAEEFKIPIIFNFRDFNNIEIRKKSVKRKITDNYVFIEFVNALLFNKVGVKEKSIQEMFESGKFIFFLDGFDELNSNKKSVIIKDFLDFIKRFNNNKFVITTRPYTSATLFDGFENITLNGLANFEQIENFIKKQLFNNEEYANDIIKVIRNKKNEKYLELLSNPLFLILFINSFESYPKIPPKKTQFYWQVFDALFEKHENFSKRGYQRPKLSKLSKEDFEYILSSFSLLSYFNNLFNFNYSQFEEILREIIKDSKFNFNISNFLEDLKITIPLIVEDGNNLSFIHRSIQEYFTAKYLSMLNEYEKKDFLKELASKQNKRNNQHTFLIELISELYPYEFKKYYIKFHIEEFYTSKNYYLNKHKKQSDYLKLYSEFDNFKEILSFSSEFIKMYNNFISINNFRNNNINILIEAKTNKNKKLAQEILILNENRNEFFELIDNFINQLDNTNKKLIDIAFKKKTP